MSCVRLSVRPRPHSCSKEAKIHPDVKNHLSLSDPVQVSQSLRKAEFWTITVFNYRAFSNLHFIDFTANFLCRSVSVSHQKSLCSKKKHAILIAIACFQIVSHIKGFSVELAIHTFATTEKPISSCFT